MLVLIAQIQSDNAGLIASALRSRTLDPVINAAPVLMDLYALEVTATGTDKGIHPTLVAIGSRSRELISRELRVVDERVAHVEWRANEVVTIPMAGVDGDRTPRARQP